jgi:hypothetical protein
MITSDELLQLLAYDPQTGVFTWRVTMSSRAIRGAKAGTRNGGYVQLKINKRIYQAHRLAWLYVHGEWPPEFIDHINGDPGDNRIENLRLATSSQNLANSRRRRDNAAGVKGVCWNKRDARWRAQIRINGKKTYLGSFTEIKDAAAAYRSAAEKHYGEFASTGEVA